MNYYERHLGDYAKDTAHLTMLEHGAYGLLLDRYYGTELGIPADQAHRITRARTKEEKQAVDTVLAEFFMLENGVWFNRRSDQEISKARTKIKTAQENGRLGGRPKANPGETYKEPTGLSIGSESETQEKAHQSPDTSHQTPKKKKSADAPPPAGVTDSVWTDFLKIRKAKRAPMTDTALDGIRAEADKAGLTLEEVLATCCKRGWQGFEAAWLDDKKPKSWQQQQADRVAELTGGLGQRKENYALTILG